MVESVRTCSEELNHYVDKNRIDLIGAFDVDYFSGHHANNSLNDSVFFH